MFKLISLFVHSKRTLHEEPANPQRRAQMDGFASDSVRMIKHIQTEVADLQILLFSATFNEKVRNFAMKVVKDANQVKSYSWYGASKSCEAHAE